MEGSAIPEIKPVLVFTNEQVDVEPGESPIPAMKLKDLKSFMREESKNRKLTSVQIQEISHTLES